MSAVLNLRFYARGYVAEVPIIVKIMDELLDPVIEPTVVEPAAGMRWELPPGRYLISAGLPSGEVMRTTTLLDDGRQSDAYFDLHELAGEETTERPTVLSRGMLYSSAAFAEASTAVESTAWTRLWESRKGAWEVTGFDGQDMHSRRLVLYRLAPTSEPRLLQLGGPLQPWTFTVIPGGYETQISFGFSDANELVLSLTTEIDRAEALLSFMATNAVESGTALLEDTLRKVDQYDPLVSIVMGLYLLRLNRSNEFQHLAIKDRFVGNLTIDASILQSWQEIYKGRESENDGRNHFEAALQKLVFAGSMGVPVYTDSLILLIDGLALFANEESATASHAGLIGRLTARLENYLAAADRNSSILSFRGETPVNPSLVERYGVPPGRSVQNRWFPNVLVLQGSPSRLAAKERERTLDEGKPGRVPNRKFPEDFRLAESGDLESAYTEALSLRGRNYDKAEELLRGVAARGSLPALLELASWIKDRNPSEAEGILRAGVRAGSPEAMSDLAMLLIDNEPIEAEFLFRRAANSGDLIGMNNLAVLLIRRDPAEALRLLEKAAAGGLSMAIENLEKVTRLKLQRDHTADDA